MRTSRVALMLAVAGLTCASRVSAQTPPAGSPPSAAPEPTPPPPGPTAAPPAAPAATAPAPAAPATPAPPAAPAAWYDKFTADAFVDAYGSINYNFPKPAGPVAPGILPPPYVGGNAFRALDTAEGFALNWAGVNVSYTADPIGFTISARVGPGAITYHTGTADEVAGLQFVKQAYATWKVADKLTLDFGKFDQPFGSEVADSQLNMNYTRSLLWWYMQPLFFTGLRANIPVSDQMNVLLFAANGWNNSIDINAGKAFGAQLMLKPADPLTIYVGHVGSPEQPDVNPDVATAAPLPSMQPTTLTDLGTEGHWRHLADLVVDFNPTKELRFLLNADYREEDNVAADHSAVAFGGNLVVRYSFTDAFYASIRGEYFHDEHGDLLFTGKKTDAYDGTLTLAYGIGNHLALMLDNRLDAFDNPYFYKGSNLSDTTKTQFTTTLGVIASTK